MDLAVEEQRGVPSDFAAGAVPWWESVGEDRAVVGWGEAVHSQAQDNEGRTRER